MDKNNLDLSYTSINTEELDTISNKKEIDMIPTSNDEYKTNCVNSKQYPGSQNSVKFYKRKNKYFF